MEVAPTRSVMMQKVVKMKLAIICTGSALIGMATSSVNLGWIEMDSGKPNIVGGIVNLILVISLVATVNVVMD